MSEYNREMMLRVIASALAQLDQAAREMMGETPVPIGGPRPRRFEFAPGVFWPYVGPYSGVDWLQMGHSDSWSPLASRENCARIICAAAKWRPRLILRALRRIEAAAAWCRARAEGRRRAAQEILRQQRAAVEALEAEAAIRRLAE